MADAYILETARETAGIVVAEPGGLRFYAAEARFNQIDGVLYRSLKAARTAVDGLARNEPSPLSRRRGFDSGLSHAA